MKCDWRREKLEYLYRKRFVWKIAEPIGKRVTGRGRFRGRNRLWRGEGYKARVGARSKLLCSRWLSPFLDLCKSGFRDLLRARPSSVLMLCGCISISIASLMRQSMHPVFAERSSVSCSLMMWSCLKLCSATADLSG